MEKDSPLSFPNFQFPLVEALRRISFLESLLQNSKDQETMYYRELLVNHKLLAQIKQQLLLVNKKNSNLMVLIQDAENENKALKVDYFETCKNLTASEARIACLKKRERLLEKQICTMSTMLEHYEQEQYSAEQNIETLRETKEILENKNKMAMEEIYKLQAKNSELQENLLAFRRKICLCGEKENETCTEELMECDREISPQSESELDALERDKNELIKRNRKIEENSFEIKRQNSKLTQEVADLTRESVEKDQKLRQFSQLFETTRLKHSDDVLKLDRSVSKWQAKYKESLIKLDKLSMEHEEDEKSGQTYIDCWRCDLHVEAHRSDLEERDTLIQCLQKINNSHEENIRYILNKYRKDENILDEKLISCDSSGLHDQLKLLVSFYKTRSDTASAELANWKKIAIEARSCREKETTMFEAQLSLISKEYYAKYDSFRASLNQEKSQHLALQTQTIALANELEECRKQFSECQKELEALKRFDKSLINDKNIEGVTQLNKTRRTAICQQEIDLQTACKDKQTTGQRKVIENIELQTKYEKTGCQRDGYNIVEISDPIVDALLCTTTSKEASIPVYDRIEKDLENYTTVNYNSTVASSREDIDSQSMESLNKDTGELMDEFKPAEDNSGQQYTGTESAIYVNDVDQLKEQLESARLNCCTLEKTNLDLIAENQRLEALVQELEKRLSVLESQNKLVDSNANMDSVVKSHEVDDATNDALKQVEDALNDSFAAQDLVDGKPEVSQATDVNGEHARPENGTIKEEPVETNEKAQPPSSLPRNKLPSTKSTAPIPFGKRHSHAGMAQRPRNRTGSTEIERRASVGSDVSVDEENKPKKPPVKKYSTSHLDAFKPKPFFKKQTSLSDDLHLYTRSRKASKASSTGSTCDLESTEENQQGNVASPVEDESQNLSENQTESSSKQPPAPQAKPRTTSNPSSQSDNIEQEDLSVASSNGNAALPEDVALDPSIGVLV